MNEQDAVTFEAIFAKATTTVDGGMNITLSLGEQWGEIMKDIASLRGKRLQVAIIPVE